MNSKGSRLAPGCQGRIAAPLTRRDMLKVTSNGFGLLAFAALLTERASGGSSDRARPHFAPKARNVIFCFMDGGVSHVDSFDPKPKLAELDGKPVGKVENPTAGGARQWLKSPWAFHHHGRSGLEVSALFPHIAACADDLAVIRSMKAEFPLHSRGNLLLHTGRSTGGLPCLGSWITYGLGTENRNLPGFVVLHNEAIPPGGMENFSNGFLPASHQATLVRPNGPPIDNLGAADHGIGVQRAKLDLLRQQDQEFAGALARDDAVEAAIANYELAYRMQSLVPDVMDWSKESPATQQLYGIDAGEEPKRRYAMQCLRARRLVEAGVRFVEVTCPSLYSNTGTWDQHGKLKEGHEKNAHVTDQAVAGLLKDLKARGLLDETLVLWSGEFGRTPHSAGRDGRDHHPEGFSLWLAGGGVKGGTICGRTDELGMHAVENVVTLHDLHATILHLLGLDHEKLIYRSGGRDFRLTDVRGRVVKEILA